MAGKKRPKFLQTPTLKPLSKLGHPRRERHLHDGGIDIPQGVLGSERTLRPRGGFVSTGQFGDLFDRHTQGSAASSLSDLDWISARRSILPQIGR